LSKSRFIAALALLVIAAAGTVLLLRHRQPTQTAADDGYADPVTCLQCHATEAAGYARTGMAHAFYKPDASNTVGSPANAAQFYHAASATFFKLTAHDGKYYQRRWQTGFNGSPDNVEESTIDYIMGSGNHVRTYLHREQDGTLIELPLAWYSEGGGQWGMNPGFDNSHPMTRRTIAYECMFCHNGYPEIPPAAHRDLSASPVYGTVLPEGIDCQRCHGPGSAHVKAARTQDASLELIRAKILNPKRLSNDRQMEVCEQCHLETTSRMLPDRIRHYNQEPFSYRAGQPLAEFNSYFTRDPAKDRTDSIQIVSAPYRLRQSQCYLKSEGALTCEICHNPHDLHKGPESAAFYANICMRCHAATLPAKVAAHQHPAANDCVSCHMPKRRTEDVVHAVMTDHLIQRFAPPASVLLAAQQETPDTPAVAYHGPVKRYLLDHEKIAPSDALYDAAAQVIDSSNLEGGIPALKELIRTQRPTQPNFYLELGDAMRHAGDLSGAIDSYRQALALDPLSSRAQRRLGVALEGAGKADEALAIMKTATEREPGNVLFWYERALIEARSGSADMAIADLRKALELEPDVADAQNSLGSLLAQKGDIRAAESAFRAALAINPYDSGTRSNLGRLLASRQDWKQAAFQLQKAVQLDQTNVSAHANYGVVLLQMDRLAEARSEFEAALHLDPAYATAQLDLAEILIQQGQFTAAAPLLEKAEQSPAPEISGRARELTQRLKHR
jgi:tetratricopeptide (TPR) repeat protein